MRLSTYLIGIPVAVVTAIVAVANRQVVTFTLDPFSLSHPAPDVTVHMPLFVLLLLALALGALLGGTVAHISRIRRDRARTKSANSGLPARAAGSKPPEE